ncbi:hypothetical protein NL676_039402 [Syzygium grande]|nr:hypothetical protein NL676_039402 [Syzygium grande]
MHHYPLLIVIGYGARSTVSTEGDVYSFGVLVLEIFTSKRRTDDMFENGLELHRLAKAALADRVEKVINPVLLNEIEEPEKRQTSLEREKTKAGVVFRSFWFQSSK